MQCPQWAFKFASTENTKAYDPDHILIEGFIQYYVTGKKFVGLIGLPKPYFFLQISSKRLGYDNKNQAAKLRILQYEVR